MKWEEWGASLRKCQKLGAAWALGGRKWGPLRALPTRCASPSLTQVGVLAQRIWLLQPGKRCCLLAGRACGSVPPRQYMIMGVEWCRGRVSSVVVVLSACGIRVPWSGIKPTPFALKAQSLNHWTTREVPWTCLLKEHRILLPEEEGKHTGFSSQKCPLPDKETEAWRG